MKLSELQNNWEILAQRDPMWAILSDPNRKGGKWSSAEFFQSGQVGIANIFDAIEAAKFPLQRGTALDFGCGLGRLTQALAGRFERVYGVDISPSMISQALQHNQFGDACQYIVNDAPDLHCFPDNQFDFIYSDAVLQHIPPEAGQRYIAEFVRVLKPGGLAIFQVPSASRTAPAAMDANAPKQQAQQEPPRSGTLGRMLRFFLHRRRTLQPQHPAAEVRQEPPQATPPELEHLIQMHCIPRDEVLRIIQDGGAMLLQAVEDNWSGPEWLGFRYWVTKPTSSATSSGPSLDKA